MHELGQEVAAKAAPTRIGFGPWQSWMRKVLSQMATSSRKLSECMQDRADTIRGLFIGISAHQKLEHLTSLVHLLGYESVAIFGDCFDEVILTCFLQCRLKIDLLLHILSCCALFTKS